LRLCFLTVVARTSWLSQESWSKGHNGPWGQLKFIPIKLQTPTESSKSRITVEVL
jgi:hypothetical protein